MSKMILRIFLAVFVFFLAVSAVSAHGNHNFDSSGFVYQEKASGYDNVKKEYVSPDGREKVTVTERSRYSTSRPFGTTKRTKTTTVKSTYEDYPAVSGDVYYYNYDMYGYPSSHWRYKKMYNYHDYGSDDYPNDYYYSPRYSHMGNYDWNY